MGTRTVAEAFDHALGADPDRTAIVAPGGSRTYAQLDAEADAAAALLADLGVRPGDRVAAALRNDVDIVVAFHGAMRLGAVFVGVNRSLAAPEQAALLDVARPTLLLVDPADELAPAGAADGPGPSPASAAGTAGAGAAGIRTYAVGAGGAWSAGLRAHAGAGRKAPPDPHAPAGIAFTSGTTGLPRGIVHSQHNLLLPAAALARRYDPDLRKGDCLPLTILNMLVLTTLLASAAGGTTVLTDRRDVPGVVAWLAAERVTVWNGVPTQLRRMVDDPALDPAALAGLAEVWVGGAGCPDELLAAFERRFGVPVSATYGLTEAPSVVAIDPAGSHRAGASGRSLPHLDVRILDDAGRELATGEVGEITVRGREGHEAAYTPMLGEWGGPDLAGSELRTGDLGTVDADGWLTVADRRKLLIVRGGANVYPAEVERVLAAADGVHEAVVLGVDDPDLGQRVAAVVERAPGTVPTEPALIAHCRERLARYKVPERIVLVDALPRNAMGKPVRAALGALLTR